MKSLIATLGVVGVLVAAVAAGEIEDLEKLLDNPPATGLLVTTVFEGTPGKEAGMAPGDVVLSYGGIEVTDLEGLNRAKEAKAKDESIEVRVLRGDKVVVFAFAPGQVGVNLVPVTKGVPAAPLPKATPFEWDFSALEKSPRDDWYEFHFAGTDKVGFEHAVLRIEDGHLVLRREVAFDGGEKWGLNHFDCTVKLALEPSLHAVSTRFANPITKWVGEGRLDREKKQWIFSWGGEGQESGERTMPVTAEYLPDYVMESLAGFLPRKVGTSFHFRTLAVGWPAPSMTSALHAVAEEELTIGDATVKTMRFEIASRGGPVSATHWIDGSGIVMKSDYGGATAIRCTKERALEGLHEKIVPRTAERAPKEAPDEPAKESPAPK